MMTEICEYLHNWFDRGQQKIYGEFVVADGAISSLDGVEIGLKEGQYYRIVGSALNDGVWRYPQENIPEQLRDETFQGSVWLMAVPPAVIKISQDIDAWQAKYGGVGEQSMSPYSSESFGGYSYTKTTGGTTASGASVNGWIAVFGNLLSRWKKL